MQAGTPVEGQALPKSPPARAEAGPAEGAVRPGKAKAARSHSLSARYGEVETDEPRYKPRDPNAAAGGAMLSIVGVSRGHCWSGMRASFSWCHCRAGNMGGVRAWAAGKIAGVLSAWHPPQLALEALHIRNGDLWASLTGEAIPRHIQNVDLSLRLGRDYRSLTLDITGAHPAQSAQPRLWPWDTGEVRLQRAFPGVSEKRTRRACEEEAAMVACRPGA